MATRVGGMQAIVEGEVAGEEVSHQPVGIPGNDPDGFNGLLAARPVHGKERQERRAHDVQPMLGLVDRQARFIGMQHRLLR